MQKKSVLNYIKQERMAMIDKEDTWVNTNTYLATNGFGWCTILVLAALMRVRRARGWAEEEAGREEAGATLLLRPPFLPFSALLGAGGWVTDEEEDDKEEQEEDADREVEDFDREGLEVAVEEVDREAVEWLCFVEGEVDGEVGVGAGLGTWRLGFEAAFLSPAVLFLAPNVPKKGKREGC